MASFGGRVARLEQGNPAMAQQPHVPLWFVRDDGGVEDAITHAVISQGEQDTVLDGLRRRYPFHRGPRYVVVELASTRGEN